MSDFRETLYTIDKRGRRKWVYSALVKGRFFTRRSAVIYFLMAVYLCLPWLVINGEQGLHFDLPGRRFLVFGQVFWATDTSFLFLILGGLALSLFLFTALVGRVWCGWACPETVFLEFLFRPLERLIEGGPAARLRLDQSPWNTRKILTKALKYSVFAVCAWILASTFLAYFVGREALLSMMLESPQNHLTPFIFTLALMFLLLFQFGWFREQFCTVLCPYARFQSVLLDSDSLIVGYDSKRGEPRGKVKRAPLEQGELKNGDCVDCKMCIKVCPTAIDIRNGLQLECIQCTACIDACDSIMDNLGRPRGLIRYATENQLLGSGLHWHRPRIFVYGLGLLLFIGFFSYRLTSRQLIEAQILRGSGDVPFAILADGNISNHLSIRLGNKGRRQRLISVTIVEPAGIKAVIPIDPFPVLAESIQTVPLFLTFPRKILVQGKKQVSVRVKDDLGFEHFENVTILGPGN